MRFDLAEPRRPSFVLLGSSALRSSSVFSVTSSDLRPDHIVLPRTGVSSRVLDWSSRQDAAISRNSVPAYMGVEMKRVVGTLEEQRLQTASYLLAFSGSRGVTEWGAAASRRMAVSLFRPARRLGGWAGPYIYADAFEPQVKRELTTVRRQATLIAALTVMDAQTLERREALDAVQSPRRPASFVSSPPHALRLAQTQRQDRQDDPTPPDSEVVSSPREPRAGPRQKNHSEDRGDLSEPPAVYDADVSAPPSCRPRCREPEPSAPGLRPLTWLGV